MKGIFTILGIALILAGAFALIYGGFSYKTQQTVMDIGPIEAQTETRERFPIHPILSVIMLGAGGYLVYRGR